MCMGSSVVPMRWKNSFLVNYAHFSFAIRQLEQKRERRWREKKTICIQRAHLLPGRCTIIHRIKSSWSTTTTTATTSKTKTFAFTILLMASQKKKTEPLSLSNAFWTPVSLAACRSLALAYISPFELYVPHTLTALASALVCLSHQVYVG